MGLIQFVMQGKSAIRPAVVHQLCEMLNADIVPAQSLDGKQASCIVAAVKGEGRCWVGQNIVATADALNSIGIQVNMTLRECRTLASELHASAAILAYLVFQTKSV